MRVGLAVMAGIGIVLTACEEEPDDFGIAPTLDTREAPETPEELVERMVEAIGTTGDVLHVRAVGTTRESGGDEVLMGTYEGWFDFVAAAARLDYEKGPENTTDTPEAVSYWFLEDDEYQQGPDDDAPRLVTGAWEGCLGAKPLMAEVLACGPTVFAGRYQPTTEPEVITGEWAGIQAAAIGYAFEREVPVDDGPPSPPTPTPDAGTATVEPETETFTVEYEFWVDAGTYFPFAIRIVFSSGGEELGVFELRYETDLIDRDDFDAELLDPRAAGYRTDDEAEMDLLDNPYDDAPVYWLGRAFDGGEGIGLLSLERVDIRYNVTRPTLITLDYQGDDGRVRLEVWTQEGWQHFEDELQEADGNSGRWPFAEACRELTPIVAGEYEGNIIAGYDYGRGLPEGTTTVVTPGVEPPTATPFPEQPCPDEERDEFMAEVFVDEEYVVTVNAPNGIFEIGEPFEAYDSPEALIAIAEGLRLRGDGE